MGPKIFMWVVATALIRTCQQMEKFSRIFCTDCLLLIKTGTSCSREKLQSGRWFGVKTKRCQIIRQISASLKVRECENCTLYYVALKVIRWNKCDVHTVVFVVGKRQQKLKCCGRVSSTTRAFTTLIEK